MPARHLSLSLFHPRKRRRHTFSVRFSGGKREEQRLESRLRRKGEGRGRTQKLKTQQSRPDTVAHSSRFELISREKQRERRRSKARAVSLSLLFSLLSSLFLRSFRRATRVHPAADGQREREREQRRERKKRIPFPIVGARRSPHRSGENSLSVFSQPWPPLSRSSRTTCASTRSTSCE